MSRLPINDYYERHRLLRGQWLSDPRPFAFLNSKEQWELHAYYQPDRPMTPNELREHRKQVLKTDHSLANRAGKIYARLHRIMSGDELPTKYPLPVQSAMMSPEPDYRRLARPRIALARLQLDEKRRANGTRVMSLPDNR